MGSAALSSPAPSDAASEKAAAPTIRVPRYATKSSSAESARPATVMPASKARAFSPPSGLGSSLLWLREEKSRSEKIRDGESQKRQDAGARKGREVAIHYVFPMICSSGGSKVASLKRRVRSQLAR